MAHTCMIDGKVQQERGKRIILAICNRGIYVCVPSDHFWAENLRQRFLMFACSGGPRASLAHGLASTRSCRVLICDRPLLARPHHDQTVRNPLTRVVAVVLSDVNNVPVLEAESYRECLKLQTQRRCARGCRLPLVPRSDSLPLHSWHPD